MQRLLRATRVDLAAPRVVASLLIAAWVGTGCNPHSVKRRPAPPVTMPGAYTRTPPATPAGGADAAGGRWWEGFGDPGLNDTLRRALGSSFDLRRAWARLRQAEAALRGAGAGWWPQVQAEAGVSRTRSVMNTGGPAGTIDTTTTQYPLSLAASYEVDVWGRVAAQRKAADLEVLATRADVEAAAMSVGAQVVDTWFALAEQREQERLLQEQMQLSSTLLGVLEHRFGQGQASALDVLQQRQQLSSLQARAPGIRARRAQLEHALELSVGQVPGAGLQRQPGSLPEAPPLPALGLPAQLLNQRPDLRATRARVEAADHRIGAALAERFPALRLSASTGFRGLSPAELLTNWIWSLGANLVAPLVDGGRRRAEVERAEAALEELVAAYGQAALRGLGEVQDALVAESAAREELTARRTQLTLAQQTLDEARARYLSGVGDYLPVLSALGSLQQVEQQVVAQQRAVLAQRVGLHRALGGGWTAALQPAGAGNARAGADDEIIATEVPR